MKNQTLALLTTICFFSALVIVNSCKKKQMDNLVVNPPTDTTLRIPDENMLYGYVQSIVGTYPHRHIGTSGWTAGINFITNKFTEFGLQNVTQETFPCPVWDATAYSLKVDSLGTQISIPCYYEYWSGFTPATGLTAPLIYIGTSLGTTENVTGKIVVADINFTMTNGSPNPFVRPNHLGLPESNLLSLADVYWRCKNRGAAGIAFILKNSNTNNPQYMYPTMDSIPWTLPSLFVGKNDGNRLRQLAQNNYTANFVLSGSITNGNGINVYATLPGKNNTDSCIIISTHADSPFSGAVEDGAGVASVLAQAKAWSQLPQEQRKYKMIFVATAAHFFYDDIGSRRFAIKHQDWLNKCKVLMVLEHLAAKKVTYLNDNMIIGTGIDPAIIYHSAGVVEPELNNMLNTYSPFTSATKDVTNDPLSAASGYLKTKPDLNYVSFITAPYYLVFSEDKIDKVDKTALYNANASIAKLIKVYSKTL